jgi:hypothetical protein
MCICKAYIFLLVILEMYVTLVLPFLELIKFEVAKLWLIIIQNIFKIIFFISISSL